MLNFEKFEQPLPENSESENDINTHSRKSLNFSFNKSSWLTFGIYTSIAIYLILNIISEIMHANNLKLPLNFNSILLQLIIFIILIFGSLLTFIISFINENSKLRINSIKFTNLIYPLISVAVSVYIFLNKISNFLVIISSIFSFLTLLIIIVSFFTSDNLLYIIIGFLNSIALIALILVPEITFIDKNMLFILSIGQFTMFPILIIKND